MREEPGQVQVRPEVAQRLVKTIRQISSEFVDAPVVLEQACHLPIASGGDPVIGRAPALQNAFVATGHSCWGILNAPATGVAIAEMIVDGKSSSVDVSAFDPSKFM
uniref:FAD dependent oxidoreductase domain-containing protein n=2 Tax=Chrysotila carterae TaxID=13221 RepID=A0A7S4B318_CHRCT